MQALIRASLPRILGAAQAQGKSSSTRSPIAQHAWQRIGVGPCPRSSASIIWFSASAISSVPRPFTASFSDFSASSSNTTMPTWPAGATARRCSGSPPQTARAASANTAKAISAFTTMRSSWRAARMSTCSAPSLSPTTMNVVDPPGEYYGGNYYAVYFTDPDGMKLEGMIWAPPEKPARRKAKRKSASVRKRKTVR